MSHQETAPGATSAPVHLAGVAARPWWVRLGKASLFNCFWLVLPVLLWNLAFSLPGKYAAPIFWCDIPHLVTDGENVSRLLVILVPLVLVPHLRRRSQRLGLLLYSVGLAAYAASWLVLILLPTSAWSTSLFGLLAPTYTPLAWAVGIGLVGDTLPWRSGYRPWMYILIATVFTSFHVAHAAIVFTRGT